MFEFVEEQIEYAIDPPLRFWDIVKFPHEFIAPILRMADLNDPEEAVQWKETELIVLRASSELVTVIVARNRT